MNYYLRCLIFICLCVFATVAWYFFIYTYVGSYILFYKNKICALEKLKYKSVKFQQECPTICKKVDQIDKIINSNIDKFSNPYTNIDKIVQCLLNNNINLKECLPLKNKDSKVNKSKNWFSKKSFKFVIDGYFFDIYRFFNCLLKIDCFCQLAKCSLKKEDQKIKCELIFNFIVIL